MDTKKSQLKSKTILIVEPSLIVRRMICFALQGVDFEIFESADGAEAVNLISAHSIDLLITAMTMPKLNGLELSRIVRETCGLEDIPIIMLTQDDELRQKTEARAVGISLLIAKPFNQAQIYNLVKEVLK